LNLSKEGWGKTLALFCVLKSMMKKGLFLSLALIVPALVFVFLKRFGKNEFVVPQFHQQAPEWTIADCPPVTIPLQIAVGQPRVRVIAAQSGPEIDLNIRRIAENILPELYQVIAVRKDSIRCALLMRDEDGEVLLDSVGRVRGYYNLRSREETDRLILEMRILLKQY
jgi:hypothetical protein